MWELSQPWWHFVVRALIVYLAVFIFIRVIGKKQIGEFSPFDFVLLLIVSEGVSGALIGDDHSLPGGLIVAFTLCSSNYLVDYLVFKNKKFEKIMEGEPQILIRDGQIVKKIKEKEMITDEEVFASLRENGVDSIDQVAYAVLESGGHINVIKKKDLK